MLFLLLTGLTSCFPEFPSAGIKHLSAAVSLYHIAGRLSRIPCIFFADIRDSGHSCRRRNLYSKQLSLL